MSQFVPEKLHKYPDANVHVLVRLNPGQDQLEEDLGNECPNPADLQGM